MRPLLAGLLAVWLIGCGDPGTNTIEVCPDELTTCPEGAGEICTSTEYDPMHCGACGNACASVNQTVPVCLQGACVSAGCTDGFGDCNGDMGGDGCEVDLAVSAAHCGACGNFCSAVEMCEAGACVPDPDQSAATYLQIESLETAGCAAVEHTIVSGASDRGGIAVASQAGYFYYSGSNRGVRLSLADPTNAPSPVPPRHAIFSDVGTGAVYSFTVGGQPVPADCDDVIDGFVELNPEDLSELGAVTQLSQALPMPCDNDNIGVFSGRGQVLIHDSLGSTYRISLPSGDVADLGAAASLVDAVTCANWALYGIAESFDDDTYMVYRSSNPQGIVRQSVADGSVTLFPGTDGVQLSTLCGIAADVDGGRWVWHYQGRGDLDGLPIGSNQISGTCPATFVVP